MKYIIYTLGCKVNQYETQAIEALLVSRGHKPCVEGEIADAVIVNTCAAPALRRIRWTARSTAQQRQSAQSRRAQS